MSHDPYCYPHSDVLQNKFDIEDREELKAAESRVAAFSLFVLEGNPLTGPFDEARLKDTHAAIFQDIYDWAGAYRRDVGAMTKGREAGYVVTYGSSEFVPAEMTRIFSDLAAERFLCGLDIDRLAERLTYFYSEIDSTHPFREGNSRTLRKFASDLALAAGFDLDWEPTGRTLETRNALYIARDQAFQLRKYDPLQRIIRENLTASEPKQ